VKKKNSGGSRPLRIAINGFGRIGRSVFRFALDEPQLEVVAINDLAGPAIVAHQLKFDSTLGIFPGDVTLAGDILSVKGKTVRLLSHENPQDLPWAEEQIDVVIEATGRFTARGAAANHLAAGAGKVIISAPSPDADITLVLGVNAHLYDPRQHDVVSNASCTTNCLAPMVKVLDDTFGLRKSLFTTVHPYTNNQQLHDSIHRDLRRARGGGHSMIPTTTTAVAALGQVMPAMRGKVDGMALRVPTAAVANIDMMAELECEVTDAEVNAAFEHAAAGALKGIVGITDEPVVSGELRGVRYSMLLDSPLTQVNGNLVRILAWYDNEAGYSSRLVDLMSLVGAR
jgi:glyceraldehyde 3-phosphate dehydrogenase